MGAANSKIEEDKALQLCRERKKFVKQALDGRCQLAETHVNYIQCLKLVGPALRKFVEPETQVESSLYTSTNATPEPLILTEKSTSHFSFSSPSHSQRVDTTENFSPSLSPPTSSRYHANHMRFLGTFSRKVEEKPSTPVFVSVTSSSTPQNTTPRSTDTHENSPFEAPPLPPGTPPWDFFGLSHPIDNHFSTQEGWGLNHELENADEIRKLREDEGIPELEDENGKESASGLEESGESDDEFDDPSNDSLVRSFENVNRVSDHTATSGVAGSVASEAELVNGNKSNSPDLSPLRAASSGVEVPNNFKTNVAKEDGFEVPNNFKTHVVKEDGFECKVAPKDFFSSMKDIEHLFLKAFDSGREVPRMLEANTFHFRPIFPAKEGGSISSTFLKACFSCGEDPSQIQEEPAQTSQKYLTWHRTTSSRSSSSRNPLGSKDEIEDLTSNLFDNFCMVSGSHASTLDRLNAWERKLYDEVKTSEMVRKVYDRKCKLLRQLESKGEALRQVGSKGGNPNPPEIDKTRAVVKDLHSRIRVSIHRIDSISKKIEELRDKELQPQLEELIEGLRRMWEEMLECHKLQLHIISIAITDNTKISVHSESRRQIADHLQHELSSLSLSFTKWVGAQKSYLQAINGWLFKCVIQQKLSKRKRRRMPAPPLRNYGPPIYVTCGVWLDKLETLPTKEVVDSIKGLASEIARFLPRQEKNKSKGLRRSDSVENLLKDEASEDCIVGFDRFQLSLVGFLKKLDVFAESSVNMFSEIQKEIRDGKSSYDRSRSPQA